MSEREEMMAGRLYNPADGELMAMRARAHRLSRQYARIFDDEPRLQEAVLRKLLENSENVPFMEAPVFFDYGSHTYFGKDCYVNYNFVCLDVCEVHIGNNVMFGPNVTVATPMHPLVAEERNSFIMEDGSWQGREYGRPITIGDSCWIASNVVICGGVTVGEESVIGAGSVVTRDIPPRSLAAGNPCRVIREITDKDRMFPSV